MKRSTLLFVYHSIADALLRRKRKWPAFDVSATGIEIVTPSCCHWCKQDLKPSLADFSATPRPIIRFYCGCIYNQPAVVA